MCDRMKGEKLLQWCVDERHSRQSGNKNTYAYETIKIYERMARADLREENYTDAEIDTMKAKMEHAYLEPIEKEDLTPPSAEKIEERSLIAAN